ncbi:hypothetical protein LMG28614_05636 [Paraburkholderia ultramafica]|uniref:ROK family protein n=1 Tax=Paraburkholderia ultramafica TaxID=1544867 RepID=A0A6S7BXY5_9BURK|nr:ROK family protein [Paraburkholderia ultramafica]CAB3802541.1 hypothetical protein LMG28614_05636 [Paraburkholderia ultramafica]
MNAVLAIAIEDRVDLWFHDLDGTKKPRDCSREIPEGEGLDFCEEVHKLLSELVGMMCATLGSAREVFDSLRAVVVSVPGVVDKNRVLRQIPVWHTGARYNVQWNGRPCFDFAEVLSGVAANLIASQGESWPEPNRLAFQKTVYCVNDSTACAAFEDTRRKDDDPDFIYLKVHNGINVGIVQRSYDGRVVVSTKPHPEVGHAYPIRHDDDYDAGYKGICHFHDSCYEGMIAAAGLRERIVTTESPVFGAWKQRLDELETEGLHGQALDNALVHYILGHGKRPPAGHGEGVDLVAWYVAQLAFHLSLLAPKHIVLGGRMATSAVITAVRQKLVDFANGYPQRDELTPAGISRHIVASQARESDKDTIEVQGALAIAVSRAKAKPGEKGHPHLALVRP